MQAVAEFPAEMLSCSLVHLQTAGWLTEERRLPELGYIFISPLAQEVVYETLPQEQSRILHAQVAAALAELYPDCVEDMAKHAFRGEIWDKAVVYCRQAGEQAAANTAYRQAVTYFEQGLASIQHLPTHHDTHTQMIDLQLHLSNALMAVGDIRCAIAPLCAAVSLADTLDDGRRLGRACSLLTNAYWLAGDYQRAMAPGRRAIAIARVLDDFAPRVRATLFLGQVYLALGKYAHAEDCFRQNIACLTEEVRHNLLGMPGFPVVLSRAWLAWGLAELGAFTEAQTYCEEAVQAAEAVQHPFSLAVACCSAGVVSLYKGEYRQATNWLERGLDFCQGEELPIWFPWIAACLGAAYVGGGRVAAALSLLEQAVERAADMGLMGYQARRLAWLGEAYLVAGRMSDALKCAERALTLACELQESSSQAQALWLRAELAARCVPPEREAAETAYHQARSLAQALGMRPLVAHCHLGLGTLYDWLGEPESAHLELSTAVELFHSMDMTVWLSRAKAALPRVV
jgi:tetratricopeptide (TPR) repeat protein